MGNIGATALAWLSPWVALVLFVLISLSLIGVSYWQEKQKAASEPSAADARENRQIMLGRVQSTWITGFLENELYYDELLSLALRARTSRSGSPLQNPLDQAHALPLGTTIKEVFDQARGRLLLLGEAGTGKTTLLLELARDLLQQAKNNEDAPIPVVLTLASWAVKQPSLEQWVIEELRTKYDIFPKVGKVWVETSKLLLLLDGFDEVAPSAQPACIEAVNAYAAQANRPLVLCSRTEEYLYQPGRFSSLHTVVSIQPLSSQQIDDYLSTWGEDGSRLKRALHQNEALRNLVVTPLLLKVLSLAYLDKSEQEVLTLVETMPADQLHRLFHDYVEQILRREGARIHAPAQQTKHWLAWLARQIAAHHQSELYLERFQPDWLPKRQRAFFQWSIGLVGGLFCGLFFGLFWGLIFGLILGQFFGLVVGRFAGLVAGLVAGLIYGLSGVRFVGLAVGDMEIEPAKALTWEGLFFGLILGQFFGLVGGLFVGLTVGLVVLVGGLFVGRGGLDLWLADEFPGEQLTERLILSPNAGIRRSIKNGLVVGLIYGLSGVLFFALFGGLGGRLVAGLILGLILGLFFGLVGGLGAAALHYILRFWLWQARCMPAPWRYVAFLDDAVEQLLLRKVGGGYIFRHRLLQDYFASLDVVPPRDPSFRVKARSVLQNASNGDPSL